MISKHEINLHGKFHSCKKINKTKYDSLLNFIGLISFVCCIALIVAPESIDDAISKFAGF